MDMVWVTIHGSVCEFSEGFEESRSEKSRLQATQVKILCAIYMYSRETSLL